MALSGSRDFAITRNNIIDSSLRKVGALSEGQTSSGTMLTDAARELNIMVKGWQKKGVCLWESAWTTQTMTTSNTVEGRDSSGSTNGTYYECIRQHVASTSDAPIDGRDWATYWKNVSTAASTTAWAAASTYDSISHYKLSTDVLEIDNAFLRNSTAGTDTPIEIITRQDYFDISDKDSSGRPTKLFFYDQLTPEIFLWPAKPSSNDVLHYSAIKKLQDFDAATDNPDMTTKWYDAMIFGLAHRLSFDYGNKADRTDLKIEAEQLFAEAMNYSQEKSDLNIMPDFRW